jgi:uncharacterized RDD family membrane protein YckC
MENQTPPVKEPVEAPAGEPRFVGFWLRFVAFIVDSIWTTIVVGLIVLVVLGQPDLDMDAVARDPAGSLAALSGRLLVDLVVIGAAFLLFWIFRSATPGKMILSAVIVDAKTLGKPSVGQFVVRYLGYFVSIFGLMLGFLWIAFDKRKQGWHDKLAGTVVIRKK